MTPATARATSRAAAPLAVPSRCYLCGDSRLTLKFRGHQAGEALGAEAFNCTSFGHGQHLPIWACGACGLLFQYPFRSGAELLEAYRDVEDPVYVAEKDNRYHTFKRVLRTLGEPRNRSLLDVGAYCGYFVDVAREAGFRAEGLELSRWAARNARSLGLTIHEQTLEGRAATGAKYDVLTLWDVVEHFADPRAELQAAHQLLKPGGTIYLSTIDAGSLVARLFGSRWPWLMDMHLFYFDRATLPVLLEETGFRVTEKRNYTHIVSAGYLLRKLEASFAPTGWLFRGLSRIVPGRLPVPVNFGDNMLIAAQRR